MTEKTKAKSRQLEQADLNYISNKSLEEITQGLESIKRKDVQVQIVPSNPDTALFQMTYTRDNRTTAEIVGRLQRWAGNMTHVYCDGRIFRKKMTYVSMLFRWAFIAALAAPFITCPLAMLTGGISGTFFGAIFALSLFAFVIVALGLSFFQLFNRVLIALNISRKNSYQVSSKPEHKDRERLLHHLTEIIRDDFVADNQPVNEAQDAEPLSDAEIAAILEQAEMLARWKK